MSDSHINEGNDEDNANGDGSPYGRPGQPYNPAYGRDPDPSQGPREQPYSPFKLAEDLLPQHAKNMVRGLYAIIGVAAVILGIALLVWPSKTLTVFAVILGIYFVVSGAIRIVGSILALGLPAGWRVLDIVIGVLLALGGVIVLKNVVVSGQALAIVVTLTVGIGWMMEGVVALAESWRNPRSGWSIAYAVISVLAGIVILFSPITSTMWLIVFGGCVLVAMGISAIIRAFRFGRPARR